MAWSALRPHRGAEPVREAARRPEGAATPPPSQEKADEAISFVRELSR